MYRINQPNTRKNYVKWMVQNFIKIFKKLILKKKLKKKKILWEIFDDFNKFYCKKFLNVLKQFNNFFDEF